MVLHNVSEKTITMSQKSPRVAVPQQQLCALIRKERFEDSILTDLAAIVLVWAHKSFIQYLTSGKFTRQNHCVTLRVLKRFKKAFASRLDFLSKRLLQ